MRFCCGFALLLLAAPSLAEAQGIVEQSKLLGVWAYDCRAPAAPANPWATFMRLPSGGEALTYSSGPNLPAKTYLIRGASQPKAGQVVLDGQWTADDSQMEMTLALQPRRWRVINSNLTETGLVLIVNGKAEPNGPASRWFRHCNG